MRDNVAKENNQKKGNTNAKERLGTRNQVMDYEFKI